MRPDIDTLTRLYADERLTILEMARRFGVDYKTVWQWLDRAGIHRRQTGQVLHERGLARRPSADVLGAMYVDQRMTTRAIGAHFGVSKTHVLRWLRAYDIARRAANRGLDNRGIDAPSAAELHRLLNVEHVGYRAVAERYGVDFTAVTHWCRKLGVEPPTAWSTRRKGVEPQWPADADLIAGYDAGRVADMAAQIGVSRGLVMARLRSLGAEVRRNGWDSGKRFACSDGHLVRSTYEERVCAWLTEHGIEHAYEPRLPWDLRSRSDFLANGWYIEIWGVTNSTVYTERRARKVAAYREHGAPLVQVNHFDFSIQKRGRWQRLVSITSSPPESL